MERVLAALAVLVVAGMLIYSVAGEHPAKENLAAVQDVLFNDSASPSSGNPYGSNVTIVEFFDYQDGPCKVLSRNLELLTEDDTHVRVVFKEYPQQDPTSVMEAKAALAVNSIDAMKYIPFHKALMEYTGLMDMDKLTRKAAEMGIAPDQFTKAMESPELQNELNNNSLLAEKLNFSSVPALVIGNEITTDAPDINTLRILVAKARRQTKPVQP